MYSGPVGVTPGYVTVPEIVHPPPGAPIGTGALTGDGPLVVTLSRSVAVATK